MLHMIRMDVGTRALAFRKEQEAALVGHAHDGGRCDHAKHHKLGDVTTVRGFYFYATYVQHKARASFVG